MGARMNIGAFSPAQDDADPGMAQGAMTSSTGGFADRLRAMMPDPAQGAPRMPAVLPRPAQDAGPALPQDEPRMGQDAPRMPPQDGQGIQSLRDILAKQQAVTPRPSEPPKGEFVPGVRPTPTGPTAREIWNDPDQRKALSQIVSQWEASNPGRTFKATHLASAWNDANPGVHLNDARARTLKAKIDKARNEVMMQQMAGYFGRGAKKAVL